MAATAEGFREFLSTWEDYHVEAAEYRELDQERVLVLSWASGCGKTSGMELGQLRNMEAFCSTSATAR